MNHNGKFQHKIRILWRKIFAVQVPIICLFFYDVSEAVPPTFYETPPLRIEGNLGRALLLRCLATGEPKPVITWMKDGYDVKNGQADISISNGELRVTSLQRHHAGRYVCRAHSAAGTQQHSTFVEVLGPPQFQQKPQDRRAKEGQTIIFNCNAQGFPRDIEYSWLHNGLLVADLGRRYRVQRDGSLVIHDIAIEDKGQVTCEASNGYGSPSRASATLTVEYAAKVVGMPKVVYGGLTRLVRILCPTVAVPPVNGVDWIKDGKKIYPVQSKRYSTDENISLIIYSLRDEDAGVYTCTPRNIVGSQGSGSTRLQIKMLPQFKIRPLSYYEVIVGARFTAPCMGLGDSSPSVSWRKIGNSAQEMVYCVEQGNLSISSVRKQHHGKWQCVLSSQVGDVTTNTKIVVKNTSPHQVENLTVVVVDVNSIRIEWTPGFDGGFPQKILVWCKRKNRGNHAWKKYEASDDFNSYVVSELQPNTTYHIAVVGRNQVGVGEFSDVIAIKTKAIPVPSTPPSVAKVKKPKNLTHKINKHGLVIISWISYCCDDDLIGYAIEFTKLGEVTKNTRSSDIRSDNRLTSSSSNRIVKRDFSDLSDFTNENEEGKIWSKLGVVPFNTTSYVVSSDQLFRDQVYQFRVLAATLNQYSEPSVSYTISTEGLVAYPVYVESDLSSSPDLDYSAFIGMLVGIVLVCLLILIVMTSLCWIRLKKRSREVTYADCSGATTLPSRDKEINKMTSCRETERKNVAASPAAVAQKLGDVYQEHLRFETVENQISQEDDPDNDQEKQHLLNELLPHDPNEDPQAPAFRDRRHSISEESLRARREIALRILCAQNIHRHQLNTEGNHCDMLSKRCISTTPIEQPCGTQTNANCFAFQPFVGAISRPVTFEDRRLLGATDVSDDSVFAVVSEDKQKSGYAIPKMCENQMSTLQNYCADYQRRSDCTGILKANVPVFHPCRHGIRSKPSNLNQQDMSRYNHNQANASFLESGTDHFFSLEGQTVAQPGKYVTSRLESSHNCAREDRMNLSMNNQPSLEIDCSNSEIEVRFVDNQLRFGRKSSSIQSLQNTCKVDNMEQASEKIRVPPQSSILKPCLSKDCNKSWSKKDCCRKISGTSSDGLKNTTRMNKTSDARNKTSPASKNHHTRRKLMEWKRSRELICDNSCGDDGYFDANFHYFNRHKAKSRYSLSEGDLVKRIARPTVINLSQLSCVEESRPSCDSLSPTSLFLSSAINNPSYSAECTYFPSCSVWGSLDRSFKLKQFSLPVHKRLSTVNFEKSAFSNISSDTNCPHKNIVRLETPPLPVSPIKSSSWSPNEKQNCRYNSSSLFKKQTFGSYFYHLHQKSSLNEENSIVPPAVLTSSPLSDVTSPDSLSRQFLEESSSSGYATRHDSSQQTKTSVNSNNVERERSRKDNSSVEDNYEWDSELAAESEILEALKHFENLKSSASMSETLRNKIRKFSRGRKLAKTSLPPSNNSLVHQHEMKSSTSQVDGSLSSYSKEKMEKRCAQLREEFFNYQRQNVEKE